MEREQKDKIQKDLDKKPSWLLKDPNTILDNYIKIVVTYN